jgi:mRNA-degrading endonuclease RelE of RelBE toxin-antitoxin system
MKTLNYTKKAFRQLGKLPKDVSDQIRKAAKTLREWPDCQGVKPIVNSDPKAYRLRVGDYRVIFTLEDEGVIIKEVKKRDEHTY